MINDMNIVEHYVSVNLSVWLVSNMNVLNVLFWMFWMVLTCFECFECLILNVLNGFNVFLISDSNEDEHNIVLMDLGNCFRVNVL